MKKITILLLILLNSCLYIDVKTPLDKDVNKTEIGTKTGVSTSHSVMWLFAWGDASTKTAASNGDIETVTHLDARYYSILFGLYAKRQTIAYGE